MPKDARSLAALVLAAGVGIAVVALAIGVSFTNGPISNEEATLLSTVMGAAVGALATYLGLRNGNGHEPAAEGPPVVDYQPEPPDATYMRRPPPP